MAINWDKYGLIAKPGKDGGPYIIEPKSWDLIDQFFAELQAYDNEKDRVVIAVDFKTKVRQAHKEDPDIFWTL